MICAFCKNDIENDSFFCDQCGEEVLVCEKCGKPGKGKRCTEDGGKMISAKDKTQMQNQPTQQAAAFNPQTFNGGQQPINNQNPMQSSANQIIQPLQANTQQTNNQTNFVGQPVINTNMNARMPDNTVKSNSPTITSLNTSTQTDLKCNNTSVPQLVLINKAINANLVINSGDVVGRKAGNFVNVFGNFNQISGKHAQLDYIAGLGWFVTDLGSSNGTKYNNMPLQPNIKQSIQNKGYIVFANIEFYVQIAEAQKQQSNDFDFDKTVRL